MVNIYVLNKDGTPLMPIHSYGRAKKLLKSKRVHVVNKNPFTIRMNEQLNNPIVDDCLLDIREEPILAFVLLTDMGIFCSLPM